MKIWGIPIYGILGHMYCELWELTGFDAGSSLEGARMDPEIVQCEAPQL